MGNKGPIGEFITEHYKHFNAAALVDAAEAYDGEAANLQGSDFLSGSSKNIVALGFTYEV